MPVLGYLIKCMPIIVFIQLSNIWLANKTTTIKAIQNRDFSVHWYISRVHNISREGECLTAYTCFKRSASSTKSTPSGVNYTPITKPFYILLPMMCT